MEIQTSEKNPFLCLVKASRVEGVGTVVSLEVYNRNTNRDSYSLCVKFIWEKTPWARWGDEFKLFLEYAGIDSMQLFKIIRAKVDERRPELKKAA